MSSKMPDPVIDEIREVRHRISASCNHDPASLVAYLMKYQEQFGDRLTYDPGETVAQPAIQPDDDDSLASRPGTHALKS